MVMVVFLHPHFGECVSAYHTLHLVSTTTNIITATYFMCRIHLITCSFIKDNNTRQANDLSSHFCMYCWCSVSWKRQFRTNLFIQSIRTVCWLGSMCARPALSCLSIRSQLCVNFNTPKSVSYATFG